MSEASAVAQPSGKAPLEELMLAMDVVDTLRHRQGLVERELDGQARRERLIERLRDIYAAQGIEVTDAVLAQGVAALEEERFKYEAPTPSFATRMAGWYVNRDRWLRPAALVAGGLLAVVLGYYLLFALPAARAVAELPGELDQTFAAIVNLDQENEASTRAQGMLQQARLALAESDESQAREQLEQMQELRRALALTYEVRIVSRPNQLSGVWRIPDVNDGARNYYLIVEAIAADGDVLSLLITSEEDGVARKVKAWGLRVDEATFSAVAADKRDDGIIQDGVVGRKTVGKLQPDYLMPTTGAAITQW